MTGAFFAAAFAGSGSWPTSRNAATHAFHASRHRAAVLSDMNARSACHPAILKADLAKIGANQSDILSGAIATHALAIVRDGQGGGGAGLGRWWGRERDDYAAAGPDAVLASRFQTFPSSPSERGGSVESGCGAVVLGRPCRLPPLSSRVHAGSDVRDRSARRECRAMFRRRLRDRLCPLRRGSRRHRG